MRLVLSAALIVGLAAPSFAAAQAAAPGNNALGGPVIPGVCMMSQQAVLANAKIGQAATARLQVLAKTVQDDLLAEKATIEADARALGTQRATLKPADFQVKERAIQARAQALQQKGNVRNRQLEITREKALTRIANEAQPLIAGVYKARNCGLLLDRNSVMGGNMTNDLTGGIIEALDAKVTTITFDLEPPPAR